MIIEWSNESDLEWQNTTVDNQWLDEIILVVFHAAVLFIAESRAYFFEALKKSNFFLAEDNLYHIESKTKP